MIYVLILVCSSFPSTLPPPSLSGVRLCALSGCSSSRSIISRTRMEFCKPETAATSRLVGASVARPGISVTLSSKLASKSTRPGSTLPEPAPSGRGAQGSWVGTPSHSATGNTMEQEVEEQEEQEERMGLMDTLSFPSNTPGQ